MQTYPRISANLLVILVRILVNLLAKLTRTPIGIYRGGHGGANPPTSLSQAVFPPKRGCLVPGLLTWEPDPRGKPRRANPLGVVPLE